MTRTISEPDRKVFRQLHAVALERFSDKALNDIADAIANRDDRSAHDRYIAVFKLIERWDREMGDYFNEFRRSTAFEAIAIMRRHGLISDDEMLQFSEELRAIVSFYLGG